MQKTIIKGKKDNIEKGVVKGIQQLFVRK